MKCSEKYGIVGDKSKPFHGLRRDEYCERSYPMVLRSMRYMLRDTQDARDATQESYARMLRAVGNFRGGYFDSWFTQIHLNLARETIRSRRIRERRLVSGISFERTYDSEGRINSEIDVRRMMGRMKRADTEILHCFYFLGMTHGEIARKLGITETASRSRLFDATRRARGLYATQGRP